MYGDTATLRADARRIDDVADGMRARGRELRREAATMDWRSRAADRFRERIEELAADLDATAAEYDEAAAALRAHADAVDRVKAAIEQAREWFEDRLDDAFSLAGNVVHSVSDAAEDVFEFFGRTVDGGTVRRAQAVTRAVGTKPAAGSLAWLDVQRAFEAHG